MDKKRRSALLFFCLACLVILTCMTQRIAGLNALSASLRQDVASQAVSAKSTSDLTEIPAPCELSSKSLLSVPPVILDFALLVFSLLLAFLSPGNVAILRTRLPEVVPVPILRVHLRLCVFRE
ncbi:hypothetical protein ACVWV0_000821 [Ewingella americana]